MRKIRKGDKVIVLAGKDKGRQGNIAAVIAEGKNFKNVKKVIVEGVNMIKKHTRGNPQKNIAGGIIEKESPLHVSNVAHFNEATGKADKVGFKLMENGKKVRYYKSTGEVILEEKV